MAKISYDSQDKEKGTIHPCDACHQFTTREHFKLWQKTFINGEPEEPYLCHDCGGYYE